MKTLKNQLIFSLITECLFILNACSSSNAENKRSSESH
jgi:hypothetical protein